MVLSVCYQSLVEDHVCNVLSCIFEDRTKKEKIEYERVNTLVNGAVERVEESRQTVYAEMEHKPVKALTAVRGPEKCASLILSDV